VIFNLANDMNDEFIKNNLSTYGEVMEVRKSLKKICKSLLGKSEDDGNNNTGPRFIEFYDLLVLNCVLSVD
jgi:RNA recognition motif-containing protein